MLCLSYTYDHTSRDCLLTQDLSRVSFELSGITRRKSPVQSLPRSSNLKLLTGGAQIRGARHPTWHSPDVAKDRKQ